MDTESQPKTKKWIIALAVAGGLVIIGGIWLVWAGSVGSKTTRLNSITTKQALALPKEATCRANDTTTETTVKSINGLGEESGPWTSHILDVPAGTEVSVNIASYDKNSSISGSLIYPEQYGSYNFTLKKQSNDWYFTQFSRCK